MSSTRKFTPEEKQQLLANLDIEVTHRARQFEAALADAVSAFMLRAESQISRIPKPVRGITMREFADKWGGDVQACLKGLMRAEGGGDQEGREERKRKWVASVADVDDRAIKTARTTTATPNKKAGSSTGPGTAQRAHLLATGASKTPGTSRTMGRPPPALSPHKPSVASPTKSRMPSTSTFAPVLPPRTPAYPRVPRKDESMLSMNGSPLVNPYALAEEDEGSDAADGKEKGKGAEGKLRRMNSIIVRRDPSFSFAPRQPSIPPSTSRANSHQPTSSSDPATTHSRSNSSTSTSSQTIHPPSIAHPPPPLPTATISLPTLDGHLLSFDALTTSPGALDALEGISSSAKKAAREEMRRLVEDVMGKWKIG